MDIRQLVFFLEVCKKGGIQRASEKLHISPSGLRLALHRMEDELETSLIRWGAKSFELTANGEYFEEQAKIMLRIYDNCRNHFKMTSIPTLTTIASGVNFPSRGVGETFLEFSEENPNFKASFIDYSAGQCDDAVRRGLCELGFNTGPFDDREFDYYPLFSYPLYVVINTSDPISKEEAFPVSRLEDYSLILADVKPEDSMFTDYCKRKGINPDVMSRIKRDTVIFRCVAENPKLLGVTHKEAFYGITMPDIRLMPFEGEGFRKTVYMFHKKGAFLSGPARAYRDLVLRKIEQGEFENYSI